MGTELPASVHARCYTYIGSWNDDLADCDAHDLHGTAVSESVIDIAPEVELYIANPFTLGDLSKTVDWMLSQGVSVINHSVGWSFDGPGDGSSPHSVSPLNTVDRAVDGGIVWVNAAGNAAQNTWFGSFADADGDGIIEFVGADEGLGLKFPEDSSFAYVLVQLRWEDSFGGATTDLDLHLVDEITGEIVAGSTDLQLGGAGVEPLEILVGLGLSSFDTDIVVSHQSGPVPGWLQLTVWGSESIEHPTGHRSITNPPESVNPGMLAVGAAPWYDVESIEPFSGRGPTLYGQYKPEIVGADCGKTALRNEGFCGTSQASPHLAGMAALVRQRFPHLKPAEVADYLKDHADSRETVPNNTWGYGFAQLPDTGLAPVPEPTPAPPTTGRCVLDLGDMTYREKEAFGTWTGECDSSNRPGSYARFYSFSLAEQTEMTIFLESDHDTYLFLLEGTGREGVVLYENDDVEPGIDINSTLVGTLGAGDYTVETTTYFSGSTGDFILSVISTAVAQPALPAEHPCVDDLGDLLGDLEASGSWSDECPSNNREGRNAHFYIFDLLHPADLRIDLESDVDTYIFLMEGDGKDGDILEENDDLDPGNTDSGIKTSLDPGTYTVEATTYAEGETDSFILTISVVGSPPLLQACYAGQFLAPGEGCTYQDLSIYVDDFGDLHMMFTGDRVDFRDLSLSRVGHGWEIERLP